MKRILITRSSHQASALADPLRALNLEPILLPTIEITGPSTFALLDAALTSLDRFHWLVFTSANAVEAFYVRLQGLSTPFSLPLHIAAIGPSTARAVEQLLGTKPAVVPPQGVAESLAETLLPHTIQPEGVPTRFLLVRAETARAHLPDALRSAGAHVTIAPSYRTVIPAGSLPAVRELFSAPESYPAAITFTSSSTAANLIALLDAAGLTLPPEIPRISMGPITSQTLRELRLPPYAEAPEPTLAALVDVLAEVLNLEKAR